MLEKFTPNQRLIVAVALSFAFFIGYTTLVPPKASVNESNVTKTNTAKDTPSQSTTAIKQSENTSVAATQIKTTSTDTLTTVSAKEFTLKIDTLGRIASVILSDKKHNGKDGKLSELVAPEGAKPIQIRFADQALNEAAAKVPYTSDASNIALGENGKATVVLTQNLPELTVTKTLTFYTDGHYDAKISHENIQIQTERADEGTQTWCRIRNSGVTKIKSMIICRTTSENS